MSGKSSCRSYARGTTLPLSPPARWNRSGGRATRPAARRGARRCPCRDRAPDAGPTGSIRPAVPRSARRWGLRIAAALVAAAGTAGAQAPHASTPPVLGLADALREVAAHSTVAATATLDLAAAREATNRVRARYEPTVDISLGHANRDRELVAVFGTLAAPTTQRSYFQGELDADYLLWDGGRRSSALAASRSGEDATALRGQADVRDAQLEGLADYLRVVTLKAQQRVIAQREKSLQDHLRTVKDLYEHGVVARNDLLETEVRLRVVEDQAAAARDGEVVATEALTRLMGRGADEPLVMPESLPAPPPLSTTPAQLGKRAEDDNRQLRALRARAKAEEAVVALRRAENAPTVVAQASHTYQQNQYLLYPNANILFVGVSWQVYDGGARRAGVREAEDAAARTRQEIADLERRITIEVDRSYRGYQQALREASTAQTNVEAAGENLRIEEDQYKAGLARTTDVLDAEAVLADSRFALVNQHFAAYLEEGALVTASGQDLPSFFSSLPAEAPPAASHPPAATTISDASTVPSPNGSATRRRSLDPGPRSSGQER
jgi:outer membrane protein